jgi:AcrR family transcriptional regulator
MSGQPISAQRRRTRRAIVDAAVELLQQGVDPSVNDIAAAAEVSRRTVYLHFPTIDQLLLDATLGLLNTDVDAALDAVDSKDPGVRLEALVSAMYGTMERSLPLGRRMVKLTVDAPPPAGGEPRRGHRRIRWIEWAVQPCQSELTEEAFENLVSALALVIGWESFIALADVRGLDAPAARRLTIDTARTLVRAALTGA